LQRARRTLRDAEGDRDDAEGLIVRLETPLWSLKLQGRSPDRLIRRVVAILARP